jgi:two-component system, response regulator PdtaR
MTLRVLIAEDEFLIALDLKDQVEALGHRVTGVARDVDSCKRAARAEKPDVALMDLRLAGGSSGVDASRWLFEVLGVRCIFISGNLDDAMRETLSAVEPIAFIGKPILTHQLERALVFCCRTLDEASDE